jgi:hypothetical protein
MNLETDNIKEAITKARPAVKESTINQYLVLIKKLQKLFETDKYDFLDNPDGVYDMIKANKYTSIRNTYNAIIVYLLALNEDHGNDDLIDDYSELRDELNEKYETEQKAGKFASDTQKNNFVKLDEIKKMIKTMANEIKTNNLKTKKELTGKDRELLMMYTIYNMLIRIPTRLDFAGMLYITKSAYNKLKLEDKKQNNYLVIDKNKMFFVYNKYKTSKSYGEKIIDSPKDLNTILRMYIKLTEKKNGDSLFTTSTGNPIKPNVASQLLLKYSKRYLKKNISVTMLRHIVLSDQFSDVKDEIADMAFKAGHSPETLMNNYVKDTDKMVNADAPSTE